MRPDVVVALEDYLRRFETDATFGYGKVDCVLLTAPWVKLRTGIDPLQGIGPWKRESMAMRRLAAMGIRDIAELPGRFLQPCELARAGVGDIIAARNGEHSMLGISLGAQVRFITRDKGWQQLQLLHCAQAWSVP